MVQTQLWDKDRLWECPQYWAKFIQAASDSSSTSGSTEGNRRPSDGPPEGGRGDDRATRPGEAPAANGGRREGERGSGEEPPDPGRSRGWVHPDLPEYAPVCCTCNRSGLAVLAHQGEIVMDTLATRATGTGGTTHIAVCLAPSTRGIIRGHDGTHRCGHTPCPRCTIRLEDQFMCACCTARVRAQGSVQHGAGRLPAPLPKVSRPHGTGPRRLPAPVRERRRESGEASRRASAGRAGDPGEASRPPPDSRSRESDGVAGPAEGGGPATPGPEADVVDGPPPPETATVLRERERSPRRHEPVRNRRHPTERTYRTDSEDSEDEEEISEEEPPGGAEDGAGRRGTARSPSPDREPAPERDARDEAQPGHWCSVGCGRMARRQVGTCCGACEDTGGMEHTRDCHRRNWKSVPDHDWHWDPPGKGGGWDRHGGGGKGKGYWKGKSNKKAAKARRDYDRSVQRRLAGRWARAPFPVEAYRQALDMGVAASTRKSWGARLRTWDAAAERLRRETLLPPARDRARLTPEVAHRTVAYLKAQGYRSAELYLSAALRRHKSCYPVDGPLSLASKEAIQLAQSGRGPPAGKQPAPLPREDHPQACLLLVGIWYLLRVSEVVNLDLEDIAIREGTAGWTVAITIRKSKTDQGSWGETIARDCICLSKIAPAAHRLCPVHTLWEQCLQRAQELRALGYKELKAPVFTSESGERLTERHVLAAVELAATTSGEKLHTKEGKARFGTHSLRVAGAVLAFRSGLSEATVRSLGRWRSERAMLAYLRGVPLVRAASATGTMVTAMLDGGGNPVHATNFRPMVRAGKASTGPAGNPADEDTPVGEEPAGDGPKVRNNLTGLVHRLGNVRGPAPGWTTRCGWKWSRLGVAGDFSVADGALCGKCFDLKKT